MFAYSVFGLGICMFAVLRIPYVRERFEKLHPLHHTPQQKERLALLFIVLGGLWSLQNLLISA